MVLVDVRWREMGDADCNLDTHVCKAEHHTTYVLTGMLMLMSLFFVLHSMALERSSLTQLRYCSTISPFPPSLKYMFACKSTAATTVCADDTNIWYGMPYRAAL